MKYILAVKIKILLSAMLYTFCFSSCNPTETFRHDKESLNEQSDGDKTNMYKIHKIRKFNSDEKDLLLYMSNANSNSGKAGFPLMIAYEEGSKYIYYMFPTKKNMGFEFFKEGSIRLEDEYEVAQAIKALKGILPTILNSEIERNNMVKGKRHIITNNDSGKIERILLENYNIRAKLPIMD